MKILIAHNLYDRLSRGGAETVVADLARGLITLGHEVAIVSSAPHPEAPSTLKDGSLHYEIRSGYYCLASWPLSRRLIWHLAQFLAIGKYRRLRKIAKQYAPDLIITNNLMGLGWLAPLAFAGTTPIIHVLHDIQLIYPSGLLYHGQEESLETFFLRLYRLAVSFLFSPVSGVVSPSRWLLGLHNRYGLFADRPSVVIPNPDPLLPSMQKEERDAGVLRLLFAGQLEEHKGIGFVINALTSADWQDILEGTSFSSVELAIAGEGTIEREIQKEKNNLPNFSFRLLGRLDRNSLLSLMQKSDILLFPSLCYENSPMAIKEALASGLEVIASRLGGVPELLKEDSLFEPGNKEEFLARLKKMATKVSKKAGPEPRPLIGAENYAQEIINFSKTLL